MNILFLDKDHKRFYDQMMEIERADGDVYRQALFYTLGLTEETRTNKKATPME